MPQKYKVFFNNNKLYIAKKTLANYTFENTFINPDKEVIKSLIIFLMRDEGCSNYLIQTDDLAKTWANFCSFFEIRKAAGGLVSNKNNERLFIKRKGFWDLPKGHLEKSEKNRQAALREVEEECGITNLKITSKIVKTYHTYLLKKVIVLKPTKWYLMEYSGNEKLTPQSKEGITDAVWANKKEEDEMVKNSYSSIMEVINKANILISTSAPE